MRFKYNDGGRAEAGFKGKSGDCVTRAIAIATGKPYKEIYELVNGFGSQEHRTAKKGKSSARTGVYKATIKKLMAHLGFKWYPLMQIGSGCKVHLKEEELPKGIIVVNLSRHISVVIDGELNDIYDCSRNGTRCVYGYWKK